MQNSRWYLELISRYEGSVHKLLEVIHSSKTEHQKFEILRLGSLGKCLILDGKIQSAESDEFIYHETLVHPPLITSNSPASVLIAGGGEGATIREVLRHENVTDVTLVDIDSTVVDKCKEHLPEWHRGAFEDGKVSIIYDDARNFIESGTKGFDVIILDLPEPFPGGPVSLLYTREFYEAVFNRLSPEGIMVTQATASAVHNCSTFLTIARTIGEVFPLMRPYTANIPSFYSPWGFVLASKGADPLGIDKERLKERLDNIKGMRFYNDDIHFGIFALPGFLKEGLDAATRINVDADPISFY